MKRAKLSLMVAVAGLLAAACFESNPQPAPGTAGGMDVAADTGTHGGPGRDAPWEVDEERMFVSAPGEGGTVLVFGETGAAGDADGIAAEAEGAAEDGDYSLEEDGSFVVFLTGVAGGAVTLRFTFPEAEEEVLVTLAVPITADTDDDAKSVWLFNGAAEAEEPSGTPPPDEGYAGAGDFNQAAITISLVAQDGTVTVTGTALSVTPLSTVALANLHSLDKAIVQATNIGEFSATLTAEAGDLISIVATNPTDHSKTTAPLVLQVPAE